MKKTVVLLTATFLLGFCPFAHAQKAKWVSVNRWVSPVTDDFTSIPSDKGTDEQITSWGYKTKIFQYHAYYSMPKVNVAVVNRWEMPNCKEFIIIAEHEISDQKMIEFGYKNKQFVFYAYKERPNTGDFVAVNRWVNVKPQGDGCRDFTLSVVETELTDAQLISWGYTDKRTQFYVQRPQ